MGILYAEGFTALEEILISIFEFQAEAARLSVPAELAIKAVEAVLKPLRVHTLYWTEVIGVGCQLRKLIPDYIDCVRL